MPKWSEDLSLVRSAIGPYRAMARLEQVLEHATRLEEAHTSLSQTVNELSTERDGLVKQRDAAKAKAEEAERECEACLLRAAEAQRDAERDSKEQLSKLQEWRAKEEDKIRELVAQKKTAHEAQLAEWRKKEEVAEKSARDAQARLEELRSRLSGV